MLSRIHIISLFSVAIIMQFQAFGQTVERTIKWQAAGKSYQKLNGTKVTMPTFDGAIVSESADFIPYYGENISVAEPGLITATLSNEVYEEVTGYDVKADKISSIITVSAVPGMQRKRPYAVVSFAPLRKNAVTGKVEKLTKFTLKVDVAPDRQYKKLQAYAGTSALASGSWYKVGVTATGVFKMDYNFVKGLGVDMGNTPFSTIAVFGAGGGMVPDVIGVPRLDDIQENPSYIVDNNSNNKMDQGDYILFYGQGPDKWSYDTAVQRFVFQKNLYSDTNFYFITSDRGTGKRLSNVALAGSARTITQFDDYATHQVDKYNLLNSGKVWLGDRMSTLNPTVSLDFSFPNIVTSVPVYIKSLAAASSVSYTSTINVAVSGQNLLTHQISPLGNDGYASVYYTDNNRNGLWDSPSAQKITTFTASSSTIPVTYTFNNPDVNGNSFGYIYNVTLNATRSLAFTGGYMPFRSIASIGSGNTQFNISNATSGMHVWDVTDITDIQDISGSGGSFVASTATLREFAAVDVNSSFPAPVQVGKVANQNLHGIGQPTLVIITPEALMSASNDLAAYHSQADHMSVKVVQLNQIYNEYGSGKQDIGAIRDFVKMLYDRAGTDSAKMPQYLLLMGDGSFDPKNRLADNNNQMPTYQSRESDGILSSYVTDDFFACLDAGEGGDMERPELMDIAVGRLPAADATEAQGMVDKIKLYKSTSTLASWRNVLTFVGDEPWDGFTDFQIVASDLGEIIRLNYPSYNVEKILCDAYQRVSTPGGGRYPDVNTAILNRINTGTLIISYTGHGGVNNWANARIFNQSDIQNLENKEKLPLFVTATCDFSRFDDPTKKTAGEFLMTNSKGGAIAMVTTVRPVFQYPNTELQKTIYPAFFNPYNGRKPTIGEAMTVTKNAVVQRFPTNTREFVMLGDPAMTLDYPEYNIVTTAVNNVPVNQPHDTLKALKYVTISGEVRGANGARLTSFNGTCFPLVFDKLTTFNTLGNMPNYPVMTFNTYKNSIFKGQCSVVNGQFSFSFIVPKDINYALGDGRISYYATNGATDGNGYQNDHLPIGGSSDTLLSDKDGPKIKLYMNDTKFVYGGITDANPKLLAELWDTSGINTTGNGLGHDLTAVIDVNSKNPIVLNDYYQSGLNNFRRGTVTYPFSNLADGAHTLKVKAWDILNNSAEDNTEFIVAADAKLALKHVYNYPNPFTTRTQFMFEHNKPGQELKIQVQIYTVSGRIIKTIQQDVVATGYRVDDLRWDGLDEYGDKIGKGVYVYKIHVRDQQGNVADQFQKLVVLR